jgi:hypothetical protein
MDQSAAFLETAAEVPSDQDRADTARIVTILSAYFLSEY